MNRTALISALKYVASEVTFEEQAAYYKSREYKPIYPKICTVKPISTMNSVNYHQTSSVIASSELYERAEGGPVKFEDPAAGYDIYIKKRSFDLGVNLTMELDKGVPQIKNFMKQYLREKCIPKAVLRTKEKLVAGLYNEGFYTAGSTKFNNAISGIITPSYGNYVYDTKAMFTPSGTNRSAKGHSTTYYNSVGALSFTYDNMTTGDTLLCSTNAKLENGEPFDNTIDNYVMVHPSNQRTLYKIMNSEYNPTNANNDVNYLKGQYEPIINPYFTNNSNAAWVLGNKYAILMFDSDEVEYDFWEVHETREIRGSAHIDLGIAVVNFRGLVGGNGATS